MSLQTLRGPGRGCPAGGVPGGIAARGEVGQDGLPRLDPLVEVVVSGVNSAVPVVQDNRHRPGRWGGLPGGGPLGVPPAPGSAVGDAGVSLIDVGGDRRRAPAGLGGRGRRCGRSPVPGRASRAGAAGSGRRRPRNVRADARTRPARRGGAPPWSMPDATHAGPAKGPGARIPAASTSSGLGGVAGSEVGTGVLEHGDPLFPRLIRRSPATRWAVLVSRPRVIPTYADSHWCAPRPRDGRRQWCRPAPHTPCSRTPAPRFADVYGGQGPFPAPPVTVRPPSAATPVMVQLSRFATLRAGSLRRVATRSPTPIRSPAPRHHAAVIDPAGRDEPFPDRRVEVGDLLTGVRCHRQSRAGDPACAASSASAAVRSCSSGWIRIRSAGVQLVEHRPGILTRADPQTQLGVGGVDEPVYRVQRGAGRRVGPAGGEVQHPAPADCRQLPAVTDQGEPCVDCSSATVNRARAVSWSNMPASSTSTDHPVQPGGLGRAEVGAARNRIRVAGAQAGPFAVLAPPEAVLVDQPRHGPGL